MPKASIFSWREGAGWLVLAGGGDFRTGATEEIDSTILSRTVSLNPIAYLWSAGDVETGDQYLEYIQELGGRTGFLVDVTSESPESVQSQLKEAGIIILADGTQPDRLHGALRGVIKAALEEAHNDGATIYAQGRMAASLAAWMVVPNMGIQPGLGWLENALVTAPYDDATQAEQLKTWLENIPSGFGVGLGEGAALALSPEGTIEIWGKKDITILLGRGLSPS